MRSTKKKYPGQALFQALKLEVGEAERQELSSYSAEVSRRLDAEPDLDRKLSIIKDAANLYPNEPQFQQSLKLIRERRDLVLSIVAKARQYEERGQFAEAIGQWDILRSINPQYPALSFEIEQLQRRREQQGQEEAKSRWVEQIDRALESGDFEGARSLALQGLTEYAGDAELAGLERLARQGIERNQEAQHLLEQGRQLCGAGRFEDGIETLRRAAELDQRSTVVRAALVSALVDRAQEIMKDDWRAAEGLIQKALELDGSHASARSLRSTVQDYRRKEAVTTCLGQARDLQAKGQAPAALASVEECLKSFPNEGRLLQLRATLQNSLSEAERRKQRTEDLGEIRKISEQAQGISEVGPLDSLVDRSRAICARNGDDAEIRAVAEGIEHRVSLTKTSVFGSVETEMLGSNGHESPPKGLSEPGAVPRKSPVIRPAAAAKLSPMQRGGLAAIPFLILGGWAMVHFRSHPQPKPQPVPVAPLYALEVRATPPAAVVKIDGKAATGPVKLPQGPHTVEVSMPGYVTQSQPITLGPKSQPFAFSLTPELQVLRLTTSFVSGKVLVDDKEAGEMQSGLFSKDDLTLAEHTVKVMDGRRELLAVQFKGDIAQAAQVASPLKTPDLIVVSSFGDRARVYSGQTALQVGLKGQPARPVPAAGLDLTGLQSASELVAINGKDQRSLLVEAGKAPTVTIYLNDAAETRPILLIQSNVEGSQLFINGKQQNWRLYKGRFVGRVEPGTYVVKLFKSGYADAGEQSVTLEKGQSKRLQFELKALPVTASLILEGGTPGAEVWVDQSFKALLDNNGRLKLDLSPGDHDIRLSKELYEPNELGKRSFSAGQELRIPDAKLKPFGSLVFRVGTPGADLKFKREGDDAWRSAKNNEPIQLKAGRYQTRIYADHFELLEGTVTVTAGNQILVPGTLVEKADPKPDTVVHREQSLFANPAAWDQDDDGFAVTRKGYGWITSTNGSFKIDLRKKPHKFLGIGTIEWTIGYRDKGKFKVVYKLGSNGSLTRVVTKDGKEAVTRVGTLTGGEVFRLQILIEPHRIQIQDFAKGTLDDYPDLDADFTTGNFGFKNVSLKISR